ncbi:MAG: hypothetical protein JXA23_12165 [Bacteroidales bacterium]|nr:hypothetical protein [Bacteroidales bacterium]
MSKIPGNTLLILVIGLLTLPGIQRRGQFIHTHMLWGAYTPPANLPFSDSAWFSGDYQIQKTRWINETNGFRNDFVRLYNQVDFSLFGLPHATGIIVGKEKYLYYIEGIFNLTGRNVFDSSYYPSRVSEYKQLREFLMERYGIPLLLILAPDKASFYPEYIPSRFLKNVKTPTKYSSWVCALDHAQVPYLDFNRYFRLMKDTSRYHLYPKNGSHWSSYGALLAFDSLHRYLQKEYDIRLPDRIQEGVNITQELFDDNGDLSRTLNLIWEPDHPSMDYADYYFTPLDTLQKLSVLIVGDSYFWQWYHPGIIQNNFTQYHFWYYNQGVFPESFRHYLNAYTLDLHETIPHYDLILLLQSTGANLDIGYGFIERAYCEFFLKGRLDFYINQIRESDEEVSRLTQKAMDKGLPVETILCREAISRVFDELKKQKR